MKVHVLKVHVRKMLAALHRASDGSPGHSILTRTAIVTGHVSGHVIGHVSGHLLCLKGHVYGTCMACYTGHRMHGHPAQRRFGNVVGDSKCRE